MSVQGRTTTRVFDMGQVVSISVPWDLELLVLVAAAGHPVPNSGTEVLACNTYDLIHIDSSS